MPKVYLAVGHGMTPSGRHTPGAVAPDGTTEQKAGDIIVRRAAKRLRTAGFDVTDEAFKKDPDYRGTVVKVRELKPDLTISVHHDWIKAPRGGFGLYHSTQPKMQQLAKDLERDYRNAGLQTRRSHVRTNLYLLNALAKSNLQVLLWEAGRVGEYTEEQLLVVGDVIAGGVANFFNRDITPTAFTGTTAEDALKYLADLVMHNYGTVLDPADIGVIVRRIERRLRR